MREKSPGGKNFLAFGSLVYEIRENSEKIFSLKNFWRRCRKILYSENSIPILIDSVGLTRNHLDRVRGLFASVGLWKVAIVHLFVAGGWVKRVE